MVDYSSQTVAQLKEILKERGLSTEGKKADLVSRLTEADSANPTTNAAVTPAEPVSAAEPVTQSTIAAESVPATEIKSNEQVDVDATADSTTDATTATETKEEKEPPKVLTPEERKSLAVELLNKKIARAEKFGDEAAAEQARKDLNRVSKFGVELGTSLAREIGLVDNKLDDRKSHGRFRGKKFGGGKHHRGFKKNNRRN